MLPQKEQRRYSAAFLKFYKVLFHKLNCFSFIIGFG